MSSLVLKKVNSGNSSAATNINWAMWINTGMSDQVFDGLLHSSIVSFSEKRTPSWTDRVMYSTYSDSPDDADESNITNLLYTSIPSFTASDHVSVPSLNVFCVVFFNSLLQKPVVCLLLLPAPVTTPASTKTPPLLQLPAGYKPKPSRLAVFNRYSGRILDRIIGYIWWFLNFIGAGNTAMGTFNFLLGIGAWNWWKNSDTSRS